MTHSKYQVVSRAVFFSGVLLASIGSLAAQVNLTSVSPSSAVPGLTNASVTGSPFPAGTITASDIAVTFTPATLGAGPTVTVPASGIATVIGSTRRVTFAVPASLAVTSPTLYQVSIANTVNPFTTNTSASLTINPSASLSSVSPGTVGQGLSATVTITGLYSNFLQGQSSVSAGAGVTVSSVTVTSPTSLTAQFSVGANAALGARSVSVVSGGETATLAGGFSVVPGNAAIISVSPVSGQLGQTLTVTVTGSATNFAQGVTTLSFGPGITTSNVQVSSSTSLTVSLAISANAALSARNVVATTSNETATLLNGFSVLSSAPVISINPSTGSQGQTIANLSISGQFTHFLQGTTTLSLGAGVTVNSLSVSSQTSATASITIDPNAAQGSRTVTVTTGSESASFASGFTVGSGTASLTSLAPTNGQQGQTLNVTVSGNSTNFVQGTTTASFGAGITVNSVTVNSGGAATVNITIDALATLGARSVTLTTGSTTATAASAFTVNAGPAAISLVTPASGQQGQTLTSVTITGTGTHFSSGTTAVSFGAGITVQNVQVVNGQQLTASLIIDPAATPATRTVTVTTSAETAVLANGFTVAAGTPVLTSVAPSSGAQGQTLASIVIAGQFTHFVQGTTTASLGAGITVNSVSVASSISATLSITIDPNASVGTRNVSLTTGSEVVSLASGFSVSSGSSSLTSISPNTGGQGQTLTIAVAGSSTNFVQGTTTASFGAGITVNSVTVSGPGSASVSITIDPLATLGARTVTFTTGSNIVSSSNGFTVAAGPAAISSISPATGQQGQALTSVAIAGTGTHFAQGTSTVSLGTGIVIGNIHVVSATSLTVDLVIDPAATVGTRTVFISTGAESASLTNGFSVSAGTPVLSSVSPATGTQGQTLATVAVTGQFTHFSQGTTTANFGANVTVNSLTINSAISATASLTIDPLASTGSRNVVVTTGGEIVTLAGGFTVQAGPAAITSITPNSAVQGQSVAVTITGTGTHFAVGSTTANFGSGVTVGSVSVSSATSATVQLTIASGATTGARAVTLSTGGESATLASGFTVNAGTAAITLVNPSSGIQGQTNLNVAVTTQFTHFAQGTTTVGFGSGVTVNSITVADATHLTANISILGTATTGSQTITIATGSEAVTSSFTVSSGSAVLLSVSPSTGQQGQTVANIAIVGQGTNFSQASTVFSLGLGITVNSLTITDSTHGTASVLISSGAAVGSRTATMVTGGEVASLNNAFTVTAATPVITLVNPTSAAQQATATVAITGQYTHFGATTTVSFGSGIVVNSVTVSSVTALSANITVSPTANPGYRDLVIATGTETAVASNGFTVTPGPAVLSTVTPASASQGATSVSIALIGLNTNFSQTTSTVSFGQGVTVNSLTVTDATHATAGISIAASATPGARTPIVTTGGESAQLTNGFTVNAATPVLTSVTPSTGQQGATVASVNVLGSFTHFVQGTTSANFGSGITVNSVTVNSATSATVSVTINPTTNTGYRDVSLTTGSETATLANGFLINTGSAVLISLAPASGNQGQQNLSVAITGQNTNFAQGTTTFYGGNYISAVSAVTVTDATHASVVISIDPSATTGQRTFTLTTNGQSASLVNGFTVNAATPVISLVNPATGTLGQTLASVAITGQFTHFVQGTTTASFGNGITVNSLTVTDSTHATASVTIDPIASLGYRNVSLFTSTETAIGNSLFQVLQGSAVISSVSPAGGSQGQQSLSVLITGTNTHFTAGQTSADFGSGITVNTLTLNSATSATAVINIDPGAAIGLRNLNVYTGGEVATLANAFTVNAATPILTTVNQNNGQLGQTIATIAIVGQFTHFTSASTVSFGNGITVNSVTFADATHLTTGITISGTAVLGYRNVTVTTGTEAATGNSLFQVLQGGAVISSLTPAGGRQGQTGLSVNITGLNTNFAQGTTVAFFGYDTTVTSLTVNSTTSATAVLSINANATTGPRNVTLTTGGETASITNGFSVTVGQATISSVNPATAHQGDTNVAVTVTGNFTNFVNGTTTASFGPGVTVNSLTVTDSTHATANLTFSNSAAPGNRDVTLTTGTEVATLTAGFVVTAGNPSITSVNPAQSSQGVSLTVQITGAFTHFTQGQSVVTFGNGITAGTVTVNGPTMLSVPITIASGTTAGARAVSVTTGTETVTLNAGFLVQPGTPMITVISPNIGLPNSNVNVSITGQFTNFVSGSTTANFGAGITAGAVTVNSPTTATVSLTIDAAAVIGARNVTLTTGTEVDSVINGFTVQANTTTAPSIISISPAASSSNAPLNAAITVQFSEPMDRTLFTAINFYLYDTVASVKVPTTATVDASGRIATLVPTQLLGVSRQFYTYLYGLKDTSGNALPYTVDYFTTGFTTATTGPAFLTSNISNGDINVPLNAPIVLQFSAPINPVSLTAGFQVSSGGNPVNGTSALDNTATILTFTPAAAFTASASYSVGYGSQITDPAGNNLTNPGSFSFTAGTAADTTGPTVTSATPIANETGVGTNVAMRVRFDRKVNPISITNSNFYIYNANNSAITYAGTIAVSADRLSASFTPSTPLPALTQFYFQLYSYSGQNGVAGNGIARYFTTGPSTDTAAPTVISVSPANNTTGIPVNGRISFLFSKPIDATSFLNTSLLLSTSATYTAPLAGLFTLSSDQLSASFVPTAALTVSTPYFIELLGLRDIDGNPLATFSSTFTTRASSTPDTTQGTVTSINPASGATNVAINTTITINISKPIDVTSLRVNTGNDSVAIFATPNGGAQTQVAGTVSVTNTSNTAVVVFTPASPLPLNASVTVQTPYNVYIKDLAGNNVSSAYDTFTTVSGTDTSLPVVTSVTPANGATAVGQNTPVVLTFSKPLNSATVNSNYFSLFNGSTRLSTGVSRSSDGQTVTLTASLPASSTIGVVATSGVTDLVGNHLADFASSFTSAALPATNRPNVTTVRPGNGATGVSPSSPVTLIIDSPLNPTTVPGALHVSQNGVLVSGTTLVSPNGQSILFTPGAAFQAGALVQVFLDTTAKSTSGFSLNNYSSQFTVSPNTSTTAPIISAISPTYGATISYLNPVIDIQFSKPIDPATVNATNIYIKQNDSVAIPGSVSLLSPMVIRFVPNPRTLSATSNPYYRINLTSGIKDTQGNAFAGALNQYYFYIAAAATLVDNVAPTVTSLAPSDGSTNIGDNTSFRATFSKPIDPLTVTANTFLVSGGSLTVMPSSISFDSTNQNVTIIPQSPLPDNTQMTISINGITDASGNAVTPATAHFTTGSGADTVAPTVLYSSVDAGAANVPVNSVFTVKFSKPMDIATLTGSNFGVYDNNTGNFVPVNYSYSADRTVGTISPVTVLPVGDSFQLLARYALDLSGNTLTYFSANFSTSFSSNTVAPVVSDTSPTNNATAVPTNAVIQILFSEPIQTTSFSQVNLLQSGTPVLVTRSLSNGDRTLTLTPGALLSAGTAYTISITGLLDTAGNAFSGTATRIFTTATGTALIAPTVISSSVVNGQGNVATNAVFRIGFSGPVDQLTVTNNNYTLYSYAQSRNVPATVTVSADHLTALLVPLAPLQTFSQYYTAINGYTDLAGNTGGGFSAYFYTNGGTNSAGPTVTSISPTNSITGVPVNTKIVAHLSAYIDATTVGPNSIQLTPAAAGSIVIGNDHATLTFTPSANLSPSTLYSVQVAGLLDVNGNPQTTFNSTFTTSASTTPDTNHPSVTTTAPVGSTSNVPLNSTITININKPVDPTSVTSGTGSDSIAVFATVTAGQFLIGGSVAVTNTATSSNIVFTPSNPLPPAATILVYVTYNTYIHDFAGNNINSTNFTFTTTSGTDTTAPTVTSVTPAGGSTVVGTSATVTLTFSKELNSNTISNSTFGLFSGSAAISTSVSHSADNKTVFLSNGSLPASSLITVVATQGITDLAGNHLADFSSQFTTGPSSSNSAPNITSQRPANGATGVSANTTVYLIASKPLNATTVPGAVHVSQNGVLVAGNTSLSASGTSIVFTPTSQFAAGSLIRVFLDSSALDLSGNAATAYGGQFTIAPDLSTTAPTLVSISPTYGANNVPLNTVVDYQFSKPIDPTTVTTTNFYLKQNDATVVPATVALIFPNVIRLTPNAALTGTGSPYYRSNLTSAIKDTNGLAFAGALGSYYFYTSTISVTDTVRPTVTGIAPTNNSVNIGDNALIQLTFSKPINQDTVNSTTVSVTGGSQTVTPSSISFDSANQNVVITPLAPLKNNTVYTIGISGITDPQGNTVVPVTSQFTTGPGSDTTLPTVISTNPDSSSSNSTPTNTVFTVNFSKPIDTRSLIDANFNVYDYQLGHNVAVTRSFSSDGLSASLTPTTLLTSGDQYVFRIYSYSDLSGNTGNSTSVSGNVSSTTDTVAPTVTAVNPGNATTNVPINAVLQVYFNKSVQSTSLSQITLAAGSSNIPVTASISNGDQIVTLTAGAPLSPNTTYTITVAGVKSTASTVIASPFTSAFTTGSGALLTGFAIVSSTPATGTIGVAASVTPQVLFNRAINPVNAYSSIQLLTSTSAVVPSTLSFSADFKTVTITPNAALTSGSTYYIRAGYNVNVQDQAGNTGGNINNSFTVQ